MYDDPIDQRLRIRKLALRFAIGVAGATLALGAGVFLFRGQIAVAMHWYAVAIGVMLVGALHRLTAGAYPVLRRSVLDFAWHRRPAPAERPERLRELKLDVSFACANALDFRYRLRPLLRHLAAQRLMMYRSIDAETEAARAVLGEEVWETLWPPDEQTLDRRGPGIDVGTLSRVVEALEHLEDHGND
jgi:hypothetical protein